MSDHDQLDTKLLSAFDGKLVRKDLLHRIKKGTNVPTFVLEFLLARFCANDSQAEIDVGMEAVLASLQDNYVRPDEANAAQSKVATKGSRRVRLGKAVEGRDEKGIKKLRISEDSPSERAF